jgi:queuine tRNA-ribosyltransferase subunit QTRTD1
VALLDFLESNCTARWSSLVIEKKRSRNSPPMYNVQAKAHESALRKFLALRDDILLLLGPRRVPPVVCAAHNTSSAIQLLTSVGFSELPTAEYTDAVWKLKPDIIIGIADRVLGQKPGVKRREKMVDRTHAWTRDALVALYEENPETRSRSSYFAPLLPLDGVQQSLYLQDLEEEMKDNISGLCVYEPSSISMIPESLASLPRLSLSEPNKPNDILREISLGVDITIVPFIGATSDAGIVLDFVFPGPTGDNPAPKPLGYDMWSSEHAMDISPMVKGCQCYACQKHHRAYIQHLLSAKEMLAWTLLQIHNHHVIDNFFSAIRTSIANGTFSQDVETFERTYESELPQPSGQGPRYDLFPLF